MKKRTWEVEVQYKAGNDIRTDHYIIEAYDYIGVLAWAKWAFGTALCEVLHYEQVRHPWQVLDCEAFQFAMEAEVDNYGARHYHEMFGTQVVLMVKDSMLKGFALKHPSSREWGVYSLTGECYGTSKWVELWHDAIDFGMVVAHAGDGYLIGDSFPKN